MDHILDLFRQQVKASEVLSTLEATMDSWLSEETQAAFVSTVLNDSYIQKYPPTHKYLWHFCKAYVKSVEMQGMGVEDSLIEACLSFQPRDATEELSGSVRTLEYSYKTYTINGTYPVKVWPEFSQVGLALWPAGFAIADWVIAHKEDLANASIVELGSGAGLTGIVAADVCANTKRVVMTDYLQTVNENAEENIRLAGFEDRVDVDLLDWEAVQRSEGPVLDLIESYDTTCLLAADVVYDREVIPALSDTFSAFLRTSPKLEHIVFAVTHRNEATFQHLLDELLRNGLSLKSSSFPDPSGRFSYDASLIKIYSLTRS